MSSELIKETSDLEEAFQERMSKKTSNKVLRKRQIKERQAKAAAKQDSVMPTMGPDVPKYCTLKTQTFYDFMTEVGTLSQKWKKEANNLNIINPGNPAGTLLSTNVNRMADVLARILQEYVSRIQADNVEMQEEFNNAHQKPDTGESNGIDNILACDPA